MLRKHGIRPILNYAAEDDVSGSAAHMQCADSAGEQLCDRNMLPFLKSVQDCGDRDGKGFVQAKVRRSQPASYKHPSASLQHARAALFGHAAAKDPSRGYATRVSWPVVVMVLFSSSRHWQATVTTG